MRTVSVLSWVSLSPSHNTGWNLTVVEALIRSWISTNQSAEDLLKTLYQARWDSIGYVLKIHITVQCGSEFMIKSNKSKHNLIFDAVNLGFPKE